MHFFISNRKYLLYLTFLIPLFYFSHINWAFQLDDALIYQRYVQNLFEGHGLVYNIGERFNGLTSSLYTYVTIIAFFITGNMQNASMFLATTFMALTLIIFTVNFSKYERLPIILFGAVFAACTPYFYFVYTMETPLFIFLIGLCIYLFEKEDIFLLGIACALLVMTRNEGALLILAMAIEHFRLRRPFPKLKYFIIPILLLAANYSFYKLYYGHFLPATASAKVQQGASGYWGEWPHAFLTVQYQLEWFFIGQKILAYSLMVLPIFGVIKLGLKSINVIAVTFLLFYSTFFIYFNVPNYHWYYAPYYIFAFFYSGIGLSWLFENIKEHKNATFKYIWLSVISVLSIWLVYGSVISSTTQITGERASRVYREIGEWLNTNTPSDAKVAMAEIGAVGWYSNRYIIDILGLVNPLNAAFIGSRDLTSWLKHYSPDYVLTHTNLMVFEKGVHHLFAVGDFSLAQNFKHLKLDIYMKNQEVSHDILPEKISSPYHIALENNEAVLMVHAPGTLEFTVPAGQHTLTGNFGILKRAYQMHAPHPTDGVEFSAVLIKKNGEKITLFKQFLDPKSNEADRGIHSIPASSFSIGEEAKVVLYTNAGIHNNADSDQAFWKKIQFN